MTALRPLVVLALLAGCASVAPERPEGFAPETVALDSASWGELGAERPARLASMTVRDGLDGDTGRVVVMPLADGFRMADPSGCIVERGASWFEPSRAWIDCGVSDDWHTATAEVTTLEPMFPLAVGATARYRRTATSFTGETSTRETECFVHDAVGVVRPTGATTPALVVECFDGRIRRTTWYAPDEGPLAYLEEHVERGPREAWTRLD
jgi:hypothetical protein